MYKKGFEYFRMSRKMSKLDVKKKHYSKLKAMSKITNIPSEIRNFFSEKTSQYSYGYIYAPA